MKNPWDDGVVFTQPETGGKTPKRIKNPWDDDADFGGPGEPSIAAQAVKGLGLAYGTGAGKLVQGLAEFAQAPTASTLAAVGGLAGFLDRYNLLPVSSADYQKFAQDTSGTARWEREEAQRKGGSVAKAAKWLEEAGQAAADDHSAAMQEAAPEIARQNQAIGDAKGFWGTTKAMLMNPLGTASQAMESMPGMALGAGAGALAARGVALGGRALGASAQAIEKAGERAATSAGLVSEAGTSAMQTKQSVIDFVLSQKPEDLQKNSPRYRELIAAGTNPDEAKAQLAEELGNQAALPAGIWTGAVNKASGAAEAFGRAAAGSHVSGKQALAGIGKEGLEEGLQNPGENYAQYLAQQQADPSQTFDLGGSVAQGLISGAAMAGPMQGSAWLGSKFSGRAPTEPGKESAPSNTQPLNAADVLGGDTATGDSSATVKDSLTDEPDAARSNTPEEALAKPSTLTALDRVQEIDRTLANTPAATTPEEAGQQEMQRAALAQERERLTQGWPDAIPGKQTSFTTEAGTRIDAQYALVDADQLVTSHNTELRPDLRYPSEMQPRERDRAASEMQISGIVQKLDPARLGESADAATGAPIIGADGLVESGNARSIGLKRTYQANGEKAELYKQYLRDNAERFGLDPQAVESLQKPVLVRVRTTPVNRVEFARQANAATVARMSPAEQARSDAAMLDSLEGLEPNEDGHFNATNSASFIRRFMARLPVTEQAGLIDPDGELSQAGYQRIRNAVLAKAYGESPVLLRMVESMDSNVRSVGNALMRVAPKLAALRQDVKTGDLHDADITPDVMMAVEELSSLKTKGLPVANYLAQRGMFDDALSPEAKGVLTFLDDNLRSPRRIADFLGLYADALRAQGNPKQASMFDAPNPSKQQLLDHAQRQLSQQYANPGLAPVEPGATDQQRPGGPDGSHASPGAPASGPAGSAGGGGAAIENALAGLLAAHVAPQDGPLLSRAPGAKGVMPELVNLFEQVIASGQTDARQAVQHVKKLLRQDSRFKGLVSSITDEQYQQAAMRAADKASVRKDVLRPAAKAKLANPIPVDESLTPRERAIQARFRDYVWNHLDEAIRLYQQGDESKGLKANGTLLNTDEARKLSDDYRNAAPEERAKMSAAVHEPASWLIKEIYRRELEKPTPEGKVAEVLFTAGGTGAGKSSGLKADAGLKQASQQAQIVYDTNMNGLEASRKKIRQALDAGLKVKVVYTYRDPQQAVTAALNRANNPGSESFGRTVPIHEHIKTHVGASQTMHALAKEYANDPNVAFIGVRNATGETPGRVKSFDELPRLSYNDDGHTVISYGTLPVQTSERSDGLEKQDVSRGRPQAHGRPSVGDIGQLELSGRAAQGNQYRQALPPSSDGRGSPQVGSGVSGSDSQRPGRDVAQRTISRQQLADAARNWFRADPTPRRRAILEGTLGSPGYGRDRSDTVAIERRGQQPEGQQPDLRLGTDAANGGASAEGQSAEPLSATASNAQRTAPLRARQGGRDSNPDARTGAEYRQQAGLFDDERPDGAGEDLQWGAADGAGSGAGRATGVSGGRQPGPDLFANDVGASPDDGQAAPDNRGAPDVQPRRDGAQGNSKRVTAPAARDIPAKTGRNYRFTDTDLTYDGGWLKKAQQNVDAVKLARRLAEENRQATRDEQAVLAKFIGWGAGEIRNKIFTPRPWTLEPSWAKLREEVRALLSPEELETAERSTQYAHYTSKAVVQSMWKAMERLGFKGGTILEPGAGIGVFPGLMPSGMAANSIYTGIEFDKLTGSILAQLMPDERILTESFVDSTLPDNFYDVAIGNPPFSNTTILADPRYKKHAFALHDYFFAKTLDKVKPGGLMVFVTSRYTMDKQGDKARKYLAERADLLGAIRLPQTAFQKNAGTEVVTDVLFLRKKGGVEDGANPISWTGVASVKTPEGDALINEYFAAHPEMVLGTHSLQGSMYSDKEYTVMPKEGDIEAHFADAVERLPKDVYRATGEAALAAQVREVDFNPKAKKEGGYYVHESGALFQVENGTGVRAEVPANALPLLKDYVKLRDALLQSHYDQINDGDWKASLATLQKEYEAFTKKHGAINQNTAYERKAKVVDPETGEEFEDTVTTRRFPLVAKIADDPDHTLVMALENVDDETGAVTASAWLSDRVLAKPAQPKVETPHDALLTVLNDAGRVDMAQIAERMGMSEQAAADALGTAVYRSPAGGWEMADAYLSGNVRQKLAEAREAAKSDKRFERNVEALIAAQPRDLTAEDITPALGMNWIPTKVYEQFLQEKTGVRATVSYTEATGQWSVKAHAGYGTPQAVVDWGTHDRHAGDILEHALTGRPIRINRTEGTGENRKQVFDAAATDAANQKLKQLQEAFSDWVWQDKERTDELTSLYNERFNTTVARSFDGRHLTMPGSSEKIKVFDHVKRGAWRIIQDGNTYLAHAVGSGKTFQMVISAMEQKRLGLIKKPMMVVPNHMLRQFAREWQQLYPAARLMVADEKAFHTDNRRRFVARAALSDLDGVVITHSAFKLLDLDPAFKRRMIEEQLDLMRAALEEAGGEEGKHSRDPKVRDIQSRIEKLEQKMDAAMSSVGKDKNVRFDEMGVDMIYVDEAHEFRKLAFTTQRQVKGIDSQGSDKAFDLWMKTRWLAQKNPGRNLVMASGTPVTNTLAELYSVQRFMNPQALEERGLQEFDAWAAQFGRENTEIEADASGRYAPVTRFSKFQNVPELTQMFRQYADVLTSEHLAVMLGDKRPKVKGGSRKLEVTPQTQEFREYKRILQNRVEASRKWKPSAGEPNNPDPIIRIIGDGRLASIDMRFIDPSLPNNPQSKLNQLADGVIEAWKRTAEKEYLDKDGRPEPLKGGAQMVFSDLGFGAGVTQNRGFNARAWLEKRFRDAGIPSGQIAFMSDFKKSDAKLKLFQAVNTGKVRVLVGSSKNMGTGVNAQRRLVALHHLDTPWYPADLEQREGRIIRQGNQNKEVEIYAYSTSGSFDTTMWQMLASKQRFIEQALSGDASVRELDDVGEASQYQMATAMTAGDPRAIQLAGLRADIEKLQRLRRAHEDSLTRLRKDFELSGLFAEMARKQLPSVKALASEVQDLSGENFRAKAGGKVFDKRKDWAESLLATLKEKASRGETGRAVVGEISGFSVQFLGVTVTGEGGVKSYEPSLVLKIGDDDVALARDPQDDPVGTSMRATNALVAVTRKPAELEQRIKDNEAKRDVLGPRLNAPFQLAQDLADKVKEANALEESMVKDDTSNEATDSTALSRANAGGLSKYQLQDLVDGLKPRMKNAPPMLVFESPAELSDVDPDEASLKRFLQARDAEGDVEGAMHNGRMFVFARNMTSLERAEHVIATHEITHYGLRQTLGAKRRAALQAIWNTNAEVRKRGMALKRQLGITDDAEAVEEVLADMTPQDMIQLKQWQLVVRAVRDWLRERGFHRLADKLDGWMKSGLDQQQRADVMVADMVRAAREWVKRGREQVDQEAMAGTVLKEGKKLSDDLDAQAQWMEKEARFRGYKGIEDMATKAPKVFDNLAALWRKKHPADSLLSRGKSTQAAYEQRIDELFAGKPANRVGVKVLDRSDLLDMLGYHDKPVYLQESKVLQGMDNHPNITAEVWKKVPEWLDNPAAVFDSDTVPGRLVFVAPETVRDSMVMMVVEPDTQISGSLKAHLLVNAYDKDAAPPPIRRWLADGLARYIDQQKLPAIAVRAGLQLPGTASQLQGAVGSVSKNTGQQKTFPTASSRAGLQLPRKAFENKPGTRKILTEKNLAGYRKSDTLSTIRLSRASSATPAFKPEPLTAEERAAQIIDTKAAGTARPVDALFKGAIKVVLADKFTTLAYEKFGKLLDAMTPEAVKAGVVSDYGIPEAVLDRRAEVEGGKRKLIRETGKLLDRLTTLTRAESRVAYQWMNMKGDEDPRAYVSMMQGLPEESVKTLQEVQQLIDRLSQEAVRLGQLDAETFKRNRFAYLHRSYEKYEAELSKGEAKARGRAIQILGDQYKGRGMVDQIAMTKVADTGWGQRREDGRADASMIGRKLIRLERRDGQFNQTLLNKIAQGALKEVVYWPAEKAIPAQYSGWTQNGVWDVRDVKGDKFTLWRDFTPDERQAMGEVDEVRYAIAKTLHSMIQDVETGKYFRWLAENYGKPEGMSIEGKVVEASERLRDVFKPGEWVQVPETKIPGTSVKKYGELAGKYIPGPIWNDVRQMNGSFKPLGEGYQKLLRLWKASKTSLSPGVHMNNVMSNFVMADWHDVSAGHVAKALKLMLSKDEAAALVKQRYEDSGAGSGSWITKEMQQEQLKPIIDAMEKELSDQPGSQIGILSGLQYLMRARFPEAFEAMKRGWTGKAANASVQKMLELYQAEDDVFRLAAWLKAKEEGKTDTEAGKVARKSFLDYSINAPWVQMMRSTAWPFVAYTYRAVPMFLDTMAHKPWKMAKLFALAGGLNWLGYFFSGGDEDKERKLLPEEKAGSIWGVVPKLIRMPWNTTSTRGDGTTSIDPVFLDVRRWVPVGDVLDVGQGHAAIPMLPALMPGGPLNVLAELALNKQQFTGKEIRQDTDTAAEGAAKVMDYLWKSLMPNVPIPNPVGLAGEALGAQPGFMQTYSATRILNAAKGRSDPFGRELSTPAAMASAFGIKLGSYPADVAKLNIVRQMRAQEMEVNMAIGKLRRELAQGGISQDQFKAAMLRQQDKLKEVKGEAAARVR